MLISFVLLMLAPAPVPAGPPLHPPTAVEVLVTDRTGRPVPSAQVRVGGKAEREGITDAGGHVLFRNMVPGAYKMTVGRDAFVTLQKDFIVPSGRASMSVLASLSPVPLGLAPPPAAVSPGLSAASPVAKATLAPKTTAAKTTAAVKTPAAATTPAAAKTSNSSAATVEGANQTVALPDLARKRMGGKAALSEAAMGCAGVAPARLVRVAERTVNERSSATADEMLYVLSGRATLVMAGKKRTVSEGGVSVIPRGIEYSLAPKGRRAAVLLSVLSGEPCAVR